MPAATSRTQRVIRTAEGYLELGLPEQAVESLERRRGLVLADGRAAYLWGESLRELRRYEEAIEPLEQAADHRSGDMYVWLALAWCYKRTGQLQMAIDALESALRSEPREPILHYNLACYWCLANDRTRALSFLARAFDLDGNLRDLVSDEPDFDALRDDPEFRNLTSVIV